MKLGIIGTGKMGKALINGIKKNAIDVEIFAFDINPSCLEEVKNFNIETYSSPQEVVIRSEIIIVAVKPQNMCSVLEQVATAIRPEQILISIAAGISIADITSIVKNTSKIVRVMPNTPALVGSGISAICVGNELLDNEKTEVCSIFESVGEVILLSEDKMDAVTALSGSGPAYVYLMIEALSDAGVNLGLARQDALKLAVYTLIGAARMVHETGLHPAVLKDMVTSPAGTTIAGLQVLEKGAFRGLVMDAVEAACKRCYDLRQGK
jgi:pyrroline-5-carboxylate reductase